MSAQIQQPPTAPLGNCCAGTFGVPSNVVNALAQESTPEGITKILSSSSAPMEALGNCCPGTFAIPVTARS